MWIASSARKNLSQSTLAANLRFAESLGAQVVRLKAERCGSVGGFVAFDTLRK